jgi:O-antigen ligase
MNDTINEYSEKRIGIVELSWFLYFLGIYTLSNTFRFTHYALTLLLFSVTVISNNDKIRFRKQYRSIYLFFSLFFIWILISAAWGPLFSEAQKSIIVSIVEIAIMIICALHYTNDRKDLLRLMQIFIYATAAFAVVYYLVSPISTWGTTQMGNSIAIWRNSAGYYMAYSAIFAFLIYMLDRRKKHLVVLSIFFIVASAGTGSRKVFFQIALALFIYLLMQKGFADKFKIGLSVVAVGAIIFFIMINIPALRNIYEGRLLAIFEGLSSSDASTVTRALMRQYALELFTDHPIIGYGLDGFRNWISFDTQFLQTYAISATYSHCNYTELLANSGIVGFLLYYLYPVKSCITRFKDRNNSLVQLGIITVTSFVILDYAVISYYMRFYIFILMVGIIAFIIGGKENNETVE